MPPCAKRETSLRPRSPPEPIAGAQHPSSSNHPDLSSALTEYSKRHQFEPSWTSDTSACTIRKSRVLSIEVHKVLTSVSIDRFKTVDGSDYSPACALRSKRRVMVEDIHAEEQSSIRLACSGLGQYRAIQTTPLFSREGQPSASLDPFQVSTHGENSDPEYWICFAPGGRFHRKPPHHRAASRCGSPQR